MYIEEMTTTALKVHNRHGLNLHSIYSKVVFRFKQGVGKSKFLA